MGSFQLCRLCLSGSFDCYDIFCTKLCEIDMRNKVIKYLDLEIKDDNMPRNLCGRCIEKIDDFHSFYEQTSQNQHVLISLSQATQQSVISVVENQNENGASEYLKIEVPALEFQESIINGALVTDGSTIFKIETLNLSALTSNNVTSTILSQPTQHAVATAEVQNEQETISNTNDSIMINKESVSTQLKEIHIDEEITEIHEVDISVPTPSPVEEIQKDLSFEGRKCSNGNDKNTNKTSSPSQSENDQNELSDSDDEIFFLKEELQIDDDEEDDNEDVDDSDDEIETVDDTNDDFNFDGNYKDFPKELIKDSRLIIRGKRLKHLLSIFFRLECDICPENLKEQYKRLSGLLHHYRTVHTMKGYVLCCGAKLVKPRAMAMHMARHIQPEAFRCPECHKLMTCPKILKYHIQNHLPEIERPLACPDCPRRFSYSSALVAHAIGHQPEHERAAHVCDECGKSFSSSGRLSTHITVVHTKRGNGFVCHICAKQFGCKGNLVYHLSTHQPRINQVQCEQCGKWLKNKLCLRKHMVQHSTVRFGCHLCSYSALNRQSLRNHVKVHHSDLKPFCCETCGRAFKLKNTLINHMVQHTGILKFSCEFCARKFASSGNYYSHRKRMHPQELAVFKQKQEEEDRILREQVIQEKIKLSSLKT